MDQGSSIFIYWYTMQLMCVTDVANVIASKMEMLIG